MGYRLFTLFLSAAARASAHAAGGSAAYIAAALAPAQVLAVDVDPDGARTCRVTVPDNQLSLAIGNKGQNVRLAAKLTGWKIDIKPLSAMQAE